MTPYTYSRFGGYSDAESPDNLPVGIAVLALNCRYNLTSVFTRYGIQTACSGPNQAPITGLASLIYTAENPGEQFFQVLMFFDSQGYLLIEKPAGSGIVTQLMGNLVTQPANAYTIIAEVYNRALIAYSDLLNAKAPLNVYSLANGWLDPYGQRPLGGPWLAATRYIVGNYVQPTAVGGNGHLYRCIASGTTGGNEPTWPVTESGTVADGGVTWEELTPVLANRLPAPAKPKVARATGGAFPAGRDVYIVVTLTNAQGETIPSAAGVLTSTVSGDAVAVSLAALPGWIQALTAQYVPSGYNVYEADVAHGGNPPSPASYGLVGSFALGATATVTTTASGPAPPTANTARVTPGGLLSPTTPAVQRASGAGTFPAGRDVYVIATFTNSSGETLPSVAGVLVNTVLNDAVQVPISSTLYTITGVKLYEADVPTGSPAPATNSYALAGTFQPNTTATITSSAFGTLPPVVNSSGAVGHIAPDSTDVDDTGQQGLRYCAFCFRNRNGNLGPMVPAFTSVFVDLPGYSLYAANLPVGPENITELVCNFTIADGTSAGPFFEIEDAAVSSGVLMTSTDVPNGQTTAFFDFTDEFLQASSETDNTDRLRCIYPPNAVDVYYAASINRVVLTGVDGYGSGHYISLAADSESYYGDTSPIQVANGNGQRCICAREFQGTLYSLKERSGFTISPTATDPSSWDAQQRWSGVGPCGPNAVAVCSRFLAFVHRSGVFLLVSSSAEPVSATKPDMPGIPEGFWSTINWDAQQNIWAQVDDEAQELRIGLPVNTPGAPPETVPNIVLVMSYDEGITGPIHFTSQDGNERYLAGARKWSMHRIAANVCTKAERQTDSSVFAAQRQSQILYGSASPDGTIQAVTMGVYNDNQQGIDCQYETVCAEAPGISQLGGAALDVTGAKALLPAIIATGATTDSDGTKTMVDYIMPGPNIPLTPQSFVSHAWGARGSNEWFRLRFTNGAVPDAYFGIKKATLFLRPLFSGRTENGK